MTDRMIRRFRWMLLLPLVVAMGALVAACDSDDGSVNDFVIEKLTPNTDEKDVFVRYRLLNKCYEETDEFQYGEKINFELTILNNTDGVLDYHDQWDLIGSAFRVFTEDGEYVNVAYTYKLESLERVVLKPGEQKTWIQAWERDPLPSGAYYSPFILQVRETDKKEYQTKFIIR